MHLPSGYSLITIADAEVQLGADKWRVLARELATLPTQRIAYYPGGLVVEGDFDLDVEKYDLSGFAGDPPRLLVGGDLSCSGVLHNVAWFGLELIVMGGLRAKHVVLDRCVKGVVFGDVEVEGTVFADYDDGLIAVRGATRCDVLIHRNGYFGPNQRGRTLDLNAPDTEGQLSEGCFDWGEFEPSNLLEVLLRGEDVMRG